MSALTDNVSREEIEQFDQQGAFWWDLDGPFKTLHQINPVRLEYLQKYAELNQKTALDVGCGGGILSEALAAAGAEVTGLDMSEQALQTARLHLHESNLSVRYERSTVEAFAQQQQTFDVVCCLEMLEHVPDPESVIKACFQLTKPGGWLFLSTINRNPKSMMLAIVAAEHILRIVPAGTHRYKNFIKPSELVGALHRAGAIVEDISGMRYNPFSGQATIQPQDVSVNYLLAARKPD